MSTPNNVPSTIGLPASAPTDARSVAAYLSQAVIALNQWVAQVANALNHATSVAGTVPATGVTPGTYQGLTVNTGGQVTAAVNEHYIAGNQTITLSGDATGSGATSIAVTLATVNSNVGTFQGLTVNGKGLVTAAAANASVSTGGLNPTGTSSSSGAMMGLGVTITPQTSGKVFMQIEGSLTVTAAATVVVQGRYGTTPAPGNGVAPTGTAFANGTWVPGAGSISVPVQVSAVVSGLTLGTTYWLDLNLTTTAGTVSIGACRVNAFEI